MTLTIKDAKGEILVTVTKHEGAIPFDAFAEHDLTNAVFDGMILEGAQFDDTSLLENASFRDADLYWASFNYCNAQNAVFDHADLRGAEFTNCDLRNCSFRQANLGHDNTGGFGRFEKSDVRGADFTGTMLDGVNFAGAKFNSSTIFPPSFSPLDHSMVNIE
jgi:uncharacterized protein YjbI with pentapeptide repeats